MRVTLLCIHRYPSTFSRSGHSVRSKTLRAEPVSFTIHKSLFPTGRQPGWSRSHVIGFILLPHTLAKCSGCPPRLALGSKEVRRWWWNMWHVGARTQLGESWCHGFLHLDVDSLQLQLDVFSQIWCFCKQTQALQWPCNSLSMMWKWILKRQISAEELLPTYRTSLADNVSTSMGCW